MKVFIVGSRTHLLDKAEADRFDSFCVKLGEEMARRKWEILAGSLRRDTADYSLLSGAEAIAQTGIKVRAHIFRNVAEDLSAFPNLHLLPHTAFINMTMAHIAAVSAADMVVVVGGQDKTPRAAWAGLALLKPVLALPQFGGASANLWSELHHDYETRLDQGNYHELSRIDCAPPVLCCNTIKACERLLSCAKEKTFSAREIALFSLLAAACGVYGLWLCSTGSSLLWWRTLLIVFLSVFAGWIPGQVMTGEKRHMFNTFPHVVLLGILLFATVEMGGELLGGIIDLKKANEEASRLLVSLFVVGLVSGLSAKTSLPRWVKRMRNMFGSALAEDSE